MSDDRTVGEGPRDDAYALAQAFASARYLADLGGEPLEFGVGERVEAIESRLPGAHYAFITAWNPEAEHQDVEENAESDDTLTARLEAFGAEFRRTWAQDAEGGHREAGWLVAGLPRDRADELGRRFRQAGILAWDRGEPVRLRMLVERPAGERRELPHVDWVE